MSQIKFVFTIKEVRHAAMHENPAMEVLTMLREAVEKAVHRGPKGTCIVQDSNGVTVGEASWNLPEGMEDAAASLELLSDEGYR